jgi:hypothetical protein
MNATTSPGCDSNDILLDWTTIVFAAPGRAYSGETGLHGQRPPEIGRIEWRFWTCYVLSIAFAWTADRVTSSRATPVTSDVPRAANRTRSLASPLLNSLLIWERPLVR